MDELLGVAEMGEADRLAISAGTPGIELMENAGKAIFHAVENTASEVDIAGRKLLVVCGTGNNGGDGFVVARLARESGFGVALVLAGDAARLKGDALIAFERWTRAGGGVHARHDIVPGRFGLIVDALFGAGLDRPVEGMAAELVRKINSAEVPVIAADLPSGIHGDTGAAMGTAVRATKTVTFFRKKPGHLLMPGRTHCGETIVADIGIDDAVLETIRPRAHENRPNLWLKAWRKPAIAGHKYDRGHVLAVSGPATRTGAARLAARAALRIGAGLVTVASPTDALAENAAQLTAIMLREMAGASGQEEGLAQLLKDRRLNAIVLGPGLGVGEGTKAQVAVALKAGRACVLDADALTSFADAPGKLFDEIAKSAGPVVLTPHAGEFARLFGDLSRVGKLEAARAAARASGAVVVYKGADTVIASPDGSAAINANAPAWLATAGAGDVLAGMIGGLLAQAGTGGMSGFETACAGVWLHGEAAACFGPGLIAEDIEMTLPKVLAAL
ncbi:MAG: NAD(P)H-hydrate dehydratase [Nitratireductor sp.]|nr:NAD(P)H-hydrate dehydratase [Nitratireductor sp.]